MVKDQILCILKKSCALLGGALTDARAVPTLTHRALASELSCDERSEAIAYDRAY